MGGIFGGSSSGGGGGGSLDNIVEDTTPQLGADLDGQGFAITNIGNVDGRDVSADGTKLDTIETNADVTDATNVDAAGATMNTDTDVSLNSWVVDEDNLVSDLATKVPTQQSVKAYVDSGLSGKANSSHTHTLSDITDSGTAAAADLLDEDTMTSNSASDVPSQQSVKAYVDSGLSGKADSSHTHAASDITSGTLAHERGGLEADVSAYDGLVRIASGSTSNIKCNFAASAAPTVNDDTGSGYVVGSRWLDTTNDKEYVCLDNTSTAAVWTETTGSGGGLSEWSAATSTTASALTFYEKSSLGTNNIILKISDSSNVTSNSTIELPTSPSNGTMLVAGSATTYISSSGIMDDYLATFSSFSSKGTGLSLYHFWRQFPSLGSGYNYGVMGSQGIDTSTSSYTCVNERLALFPIYIPYKTQTLNIGIHTADASGTADISAGLYSSVPAVANKYIGYKLATFTDITDISTTGIKTTTTATTIYPGYYWVGILPLNIGTSLIISAPEATDSNLIRSQMGTGTSESASINITGIYYDTQSSLPGTLYTTGAYTGVISDFVGITLEDT